jgi:hypothetical protein
MSGALTHGGPHGEIDGMTDDDVALKHIDHNRRGLKGTPRGPETRVTVGRTVTVASCVTLSR